MEAMQSFRGESFGSDKESENIMYEAKKIAFFQKLVGEHYAEMRILFRDGGLGRSEGWRNVAEHCVTEMAVASVLSDSLGLSEADKDKLIKTAAVHDWDKRRSKESRNLDKDSSELASLENKIAEIGQRYNLIRATKMEWLERASNGKADFLEELLFFIDDICSGSEIVTLKERFAEVLSGGRETDLGSDESMAALLEKMGEERGYRQVEADIFHGISGKIISKLKENGIEIDVNNENQDDKLVWFIKELLRGKIKQQTVEGNEFRIAFSHVKALEAGSTERESEDASVYLEGNKGFLAAVFDGATTVNDSTEFIKLHRHTPGKVAANLSAQVASEYDLDIEAPPEPLDVILKANTAMRETSNEGKRQEHFAASGLVVIMDRSTNTIKWASLGDCALAVMNKDGSFKWLNTDFVFPFEKEEIDTMQRVMRDKEISPKKALQDPEVIEIINRNREQNENSQSGAGYGVIRGDSDEIARKYCEIGEFPVKPGQRLFIFTDGMWPPVAQNGNRERAAADALRRGGIKELLRYTREIEASDPDLKFPRIKQQDDAEGLQITMRLERST